MGIHGGTGQDHIIHASNHPTGTTLYHLSHILLHHVVLYYVYKYLIRPMPRFPKLDASRVAGGSEIEISEFMESKSFATCRAVHPALHVHHKTWRLSTRTRRRLRGVPVLELPIANIPLKRDNCSRYASKEMAHLFSPAVRCTPGCAEQ